VQIATEYHKILKQFRKKAKLTQEEIADKLNMTQSTISKIESGRHIIDIRTFFDWIRATGCDAQAALMTFGPDVIINAFNLLQRVPAAFINIGGVLLKWI